MKRALRRLLGVDTTSKEEAKKRLKLLLIHDQIELSPSQLEDMKSEIMDVIRRYLDVNEEDSQFRLDRQDSAITLVGAVPITRVLKRASGGNSAS
jgi:cell division topological specificity factor